MGLKSIMAILLLAVVILCSCSQTTDLEEIKESGQEETTKEDVIKVPFHIDYHLENEKGENVTVFKEGENIYFDLTIYNDTEKDISIAEEREIVYNAMCVYTYNSEFVGNPLNGVIMDKSMNWVHINAKGNEHWRFPWIYNPKYATERPYFGEYPRKDALPKGRYFSWMKYTIILSSNNKNKNDPLIPVDLKIPFIVE